jgi:threonine/homoserine/homoserine lactone efflux protein
MGLDFRNITAGEILLLGAGIVLAVLAFAMPGPNILLSLTSGIAIGYGLPLR